MNPGTADLAVPFSFQAIPPNAEAQRTRSTQRNAKKKETEDFPGVISSNSETGFLCAL
jgi:hypothetical protein